MAECDAGGAVRISRVLDQEPGFLQFADRNGLVTGARLTILIRDPVAGAVSIQCDRPEPIAPGQKAAAKILVETV